MTRHRPTLVVLCSAIALVISGVVTATPFGHAASEPAWQTFQGDNQRSGASAVSGPSSLFRLNSYTLPPGIKGGPAVDAAGTAYIGDKDGTLYALSPTNSNGPVWSFKTGGPITGSPALSPDGGTVYVGSTDGSLYAVSTSTHQQLWKTVLGGPINGSPALSPDGGTIYVGTSGAVFSLKASDGTQNWTYNQATAIYGSVAMSLDGSTVYAAAANGYMYAIPASGPTAIGGITPYYLDGPPTSSPSVDANNNIYVSTTRGNLFSFAPANSTPRWTYTIFNHQISNSSVAFSQQVGYLGAGTGSVYAINLQTGAQVWQAQTTGPIQASAVVTTGNGRIYIGSSDGYFYELDNTGKILTKLATGTPIDASSAVASDGSVWMASESGQVFRLGDIAPPPTVPAKVTPTITPLVTNTPGPTATPVASSTVTVTVTSTPSALVPLTFALKGSVKDGKKQTIKITSSPNTQVKLRVDYPNGDHQSHSVTTNASGTATYSYTQGASKTTHSKFTATVTARAGTGSAQNIVSKTYQINWGTLDVSAEPRTVAVGKTVDIFVHAAPKSKVVAILSPPKGKHQIKLSGKTGPRGLSSIKYKVPKGLTTPSNKKVVIVVRFASGKSSTSTKTTFTIG